MKRIILAFVALLGVSSFGCTCVTVKRADEKTPGLRYYLPQPFLIVTPQEDGSIEARVESIADLNQAYAISATSYIASHKLVVKLDQGLLTDASLTQDSSAVAAEAVKASGELEKSKIEAKTDAATKAREKQEEAAKARREELKKVQDVLAQAEVDLAVATAEFDATVDAEKKKSAEIAKAKAQAKVDILKRQLSSAGVRFGAFSATGEGQKPPSPPSQTPGFKKTTRPGPVVLRIEEDAQSGVLQLVPVVFEPEIVQKLFDSYDSQLGKKTSQAQAKIEKIEFETGSPVQVKVGNKPVTTDIKTRIDLLTLKAAKMKGRQGQIDKKWLPTVQSKESKTFALTFKANTPPDIYTIEFIGTTEQSQPEIPGELVVKVTR